MNELALFAGAGGGILGGKLLGWRTVCAVEIEPYCREVLLRRQRDSVLPLFPIWDDIRTFDGKPWAGIVDVISAGFPCQPFSQAGKQLGEDDERNMWPDTIRVIREVRPSIAFLENVPRLVRCDYFGTIIGDLAAAGFDAEWETVSAVEVGACHPRARIWIVAYDQSKRHGAGREPGYIPKKNGRSNEQLSPEFSIAIASDHANDTGQRTQRDSKEPFSGKPALPWGKSCRSIEELLQRPDLPPPLIWGMDDGVANQLERVRAIGNGQVPLVAATAFNLMTQ